METAEDGYLIPMKDLKKSIDGTDEPPEKGIWFSNINQCLPNSW